MYSNRVSLGKVRREENILWSFAPHDVAVMLRLMGSLPFQVAAYGGSYVQPNIADVTVTHLLFDNGVRAHIHVSWLHPFKEQRLVVVGSRQMASFDDVAKRLVLYDQRVELQEGAPVPVQGPGEEVPFAREEPLRLECQAFLEALATRRPPITDGRSGLRVLQVLAGGATLPGDEWGTGATCRWSRSACMEGGHAMTLPYYVHPSAYIDEPCTIGAGTQDLALLPCDGRGADWGALYFGAECACGAGRGDWP